MPFAPPHASDSDASGFALVNAANAQWGTANALVFAKEKGIVVREPSVRVE
jgi:hypothetical protein